MQPKPASFTGPTPRQSSVEKQRGARPNDPQAIKHFLVLAREGRPKKPLLPADCRGVFRPNRQGRGQSPQPSGRTPPGPRGPVTHGNTEGGGNEGSTSAVGANILAKGARISEGQPGAPDLGAEAIFLTAQASLGPDGGQTGLVPPAGWLNRPTRHQAVPWRWGWRMSDEQKQEANTGTPGSGKLPGAVYFIRPDAEHPGPRRGFVHAPTCGAPGVKKKNKG